MLSQISADDAQMNYFSNPILLHELTGDPSNQVNVSDWPCSELMVDDWQKFLAILEQLARLVADSHMNRWIIHGAINEIGFSLSIYVSWDSTVYSNKMLSIFPLHISVLKFLPLRQNR